MRFSIALSKTFYWIEQYEAIDHTTSISRRDGIVVSCMQRFRDYKKNEILVPDFFDWEILKNRLD